MSYPGVMAGVGLHFLMEYGVEVYPFILYNVNLFGVNITNSVCFTGLTWSQCEDTFTLHALPTTHCTNLIDTSCSGAVYHTDIGGFDFHSSTVEDLGGEDFDYAMDCGDFIF